MAWLYRFPGYSQFRELVSASNCTDYQSRAVECRYGSKAMGDRTKIYTHMVGHVVKGGMM